MYKKHYNIQGEHVSYNTCKRLKIDGKLQVYDDDNAAHYVSFFNTVTLVISSKSSLTILHTLRTQTNTQKKIHTLTHTHTLNTGKNIRLRAEQQ